jgi:hypothetical protein
VRLEPQELKVMELPAITTNPTSSSLFPAGVMLALAGDTLEPLATAEATSSGAEVDHIVKAAGHCAGAVPQARLRYRPIGIGKGSK